MSNKKKLSFTDQLRQHMWDSGESINAIRRATGIELASLSRFKNGQQLLREQYLNTLAEYLRLRIVRDEPPEPEADEPRATTKGSKMKKGGA